MRRHAAGRARRHARRRRCRATARGAEWTAPRKARPRSSAAAPGLSERPTARPAARAARTAPRARAARRGPGPAPPWAPRGAAGAGGEGRPRARPLALLGQLARANCSPVAARAPPRAARPRQRRALGAPSARPAPPAPGARRGGRGAGGGAHARSPPALLLDPAARALPPPRAPCPGVCARTLLMRAQVAPPTNRGEEWCAAGGGRAKRACAERIFQEALFCIWKNGRHCSRRARPPARPGRLRGQLRT